jgi:hypothetical protein
MKFGEINIGAEKRITKFMDERNEKRFANRVDRPASEY